MIKESTQQGALTTLNGDIPNIGVSKYIQTLPEVIIDW